MYYDEIEQQFGDQFKVLPQAEKQALYNDIATIINDDDNQEEDSWGAVRLLRQRIGGPKNLESYVSCLMAHTAPQVAS